MRTLTAQDLDDILHGACILGSGGGGPFSVGQSILQDLANFSPVVLADPSEVADQAKMAVSAFVGSPDASADAKFHFSVATTAYDLLAGVEGATFSVVLPGEVGAGNSLIPMTVAARKNLPVVDAAGARRAIPGFLMCTYASHEIPINPMVIASKSQQVVVSQMTNSVADPVARGVIGGAFSEDAGVAFWPMSGQVMKSAAVPNTTTYALNLGATLRQALAQGKDPVQAVTKFLGGIVLFTGTIKSTSEATEEAFDFGKVVLMSPEGVEVTIFNQNENLIAWSNHSSQPLAMGPDLICYLTTEGQVFSNADFQSLPKNAAISVIGVPSIAEMRTPFIIRQFLNAIAGTGYPGPYVTLEALHTAGLSATV